MELRKYYEILLRRKWIFLAIVSLIFILSMSTAFIAEPIYEVTCKVRLNTQDVAPLLILGVPGALGKFDVTDDRNAIGTMQAMIENSQSINNIILDLGIKKSDGSYLTVKDFLDPSIIKILINRAGVNVEQMEDAEIFEITGYSGDEKQASDIANAVADALISLYYKLNKESVSKNEMVIMKRVGEVEDKIKGIENEKVIIQEKELTINIEQQVSLLLKSHDDLMSKKLTASRDIEEKKSAIRGMIEKIKMTEEFQLDSIDLELEPAIELKRKRLLDLELSLAEGQLDKSNKSAAVLSSLEQIDSAKESLKQEIVKTVRAKTKKRNEYFDSLIKSLGNSEIEIISSKASLIALNSQIKEIEKRLSELPKKQVKTDLLDQKLSIYNGIYNNLLSSLESFKSAGDLNVSNALIIEPAAILSEDPDEYVYFPQILLIAVLSLFIGGFLGLMTAFLLEYIDDSIMTAEEASSLLGANILGSIPMVPFWQIRKGFQLQSRRFNKSMVNLVTHLKSSLSKATSHAQWVMASAEKGSGKTTLCLHLGRILAENGLRVLIVDMNFESDAIARFLNLETSARPQELFSSDLSELIQQSGVKNLDVIPTSKTEMVTGEFMGIDGYCQKLEELGGQYDVMFIDTSALIDSVEVSLLGKALSGVIFVVASGQTHQTRLRFAAESLKQKQAHITGVVLNKERTLGWFKI